MMSGRCLSALGWLAMSAADDRAWRGMRWHRRVSRHGADAVAGTVRRADDDRVEFVTSTSTTTSSTTTLPPTTTSTTTTTTSTTSTTTTSTTSTTIPAPTTIRCSFAADALFEPGEAALTGDAIAELDRIVAGTSDIRRVTVEGHTDHRGSDAENEALSQARADVTAAALVDAGIDDELISAVGLGEREAAQGAPSDSEMAADRRVDVIIEADVPIATTC